MKVTLTYNDPLIQGNSVSKTYHFPDKNVDMLKKLMTKFNGESLTLLPINVEAEYPDGSKEIVLLLLSSLCEKNNRTINKCVTVKSNITICNQSTKVKCNEKKSIKEKIKSWLRY